MEEILYPIPISHLIKYGKYQDYYIKEIKKKCTD